MIRTNTCIVEEKISDITGKSCDYSILTNSIANVGLKVQEIRDDYTSKTADATSKL